MNFSSILAEIERLDPEVYERTSARRSVIKNWTRRVSLAALPFAIGSLFNKAYGKAADPISDVLQFALKLEYIEMELYRMAVAATEVTPPATQLIQNKTGLELPAIKMIWGHEIMHFGFLRNILVGMGQPIPTMPKLDFTGGKGSSSGPFAQVFSDYGTFLAVAQMLEDTGVRAYIGQMTTLKINNDLLQSAMRIHTIEARHSAHIRTMRSQTPGPLADGQNIKPWITSSQSGVNSPDVQKSYNGEQKTIQVGTEVIGISGFISITDLVASEAFDEPFTMLDVLDIIDPFIVP